MLSASFIEEFTFFVDSLGIDYSLNSDGTFLFSEHNIRIVPVGLYSYLSMTVSTPIPASSCISALVCAYLSDPAIDTIFLYEDRWRSKNELIKSRLKAHLGIVKRVFARNCVVKEMSVERAREFLDRTHVYGYARSKYRYGLFRKGSDELLAVSTFSFGRPMSRDERVLQSYEWVRYASLPDTRVVGGMGKVMERFIQDVSPDEIMSYADREWSEGKIYLKLGFEKRGEIPPIEFYIDPHTYERISRKKIDSDRIFSGKYSEEERLNMPVICNLGSVKYYKTIIPSTIALPPACGRSSSESV